MQKAKNTIEDYTALKQTRDFSYNEAFHFISVLYLNICTCCYLRSISIDV